MARQPIHERVKGHVELAGITHAELAAKTGWDEQRVYRVLAGKTRLTAADMELLAKILEKPVASLYREARAS